ncbi:MAG TPA: hypothetical protein VLD58_15835 [Gemmatimonadales bacterium]|nr:hypothetical protein [Gemmatimonadales bacterium]
MTMHQIAPSERLRARGLALLLAMFLAGAMAGAATDRYILKRDRPLLERESGLRRRGPDAGEIPARLRQLGLTPEQERRIRAVFARWQPRADSIMRDVLPQVRAIEHGMFQEMVCVLTPAQDSAYLAWRTREGLNAEEGREQLSRVTAGTCPTDAATPP